MRSYIVGLAALLFLASELQARVVKWEGKPLPVSISSEPLTRIEFPENLRSVFVGRADISIEREDRSLYLRALLHDTHDTLFAVGEGGTRYEINTPFGVWRLSQQGEGHGVVAKLYPCSHSPFSL